MSSESNPVIFITGASKGIGLAVATILLETFNANVIACQRTRSTELQNLLNKHPDSLLSVEADITDEPAVRAAVERGIEHFHGLDGLILNAGVAEPFGNISSPNTTTQKWRAHFDVNFFSLLYTVQAALPSLRESSKKGNGLGGRIIFISSGAALANTPALGVYNASKAAMNSFARTLAEEEPDLVSIALRPGKVDTSMQGVIRENGPGTMRDKDVQGFIDSFKDNTLVRPEDCGHVIAFLSLSAPKKLSGKFVSWDSEECAPFRRAPN